MLIKGNDLVHVEHPMIDYSSLVELFASVGVARGKERDPEIQRANRIIL